MSKDSLRVIYMGTPDFAVPALQALIESNHEIVAAYSQPPRPKGRGHKVQRSPVHMLADEHSIPVHTPISLKKDAEARDIFKSYDADIAVVAAYGLILPKDILNAPTYGCINIHASLLPKWRGAAPIQYAIWKGDVETGITIMQMEEGLDTGPMIAKKSIAISQHSTAQTLHDELSRIGGDLLLNVLASLTTNGKVQSQKQNDIDSSYASLLKKSDGRIDWTRTAAEIDCQIRALNPWPGTYFEHKDGQIFKVKSAKIDDTQTNENPGTIIDNTGNVACGDGTVIQILSIQPPNKKTMDFCSAVNGGYLGVDI